MPETAIFGVLALGVVTVVMCVSMIALILNRGKRERLMQRHIDVLHKGIEEMGASDGKTDA